KEALLGVLEPFTAFIDSLSQVNNREILQTHDREVWAAVGVKLEQADQLAEFDADSAAQALTEAVATAQGLYGRSPPLDQFLRRAKKAAMPTETEELRAEAERLRLLLSEVGVS
ncbi:MAG TPA: hypothetical protein VEY30_08800, partial [Myxococcaceae bacterium]|nr:hypothetical protein [Myxococcaceae bacterium]